MLSLYYKYKPKKTKRRKNKNALSDWAKRIFQNENYFEFEKLPLEVIENIFMYLKLNQIKKLRLVNKNVKYFVDNCRKLWEKKIIVRVSIDSNEDVTYFKGVLENWKHLDTIVFESEGYFDLKGVDLKSNNLYAIESSTNLSGRTNLILNNFHVDSLSLLNMFSNACKTLGINNFDQEMIDDYIDQINSSKQIKSNMPKLDLPHLKRLVISRNVNFKNCGPRIPHQNGDVHTWLVEELVKKSALNYKNLKELTLIDWYGSLETLQKTLEGLNLDSLWIINGRSSDKIVDRLKNESKFSVKSLHLECTANIICLLLGHCADLSKIEELSIKITWFSPDIGIVMFLDDDSLLPRLLKKISGKLTNLKELIYDDDASELMDNSFKLSMKLSRATFGDPLTLDEAINFIQGYLCDYKTIENFGLSIIVNCKKRNSAYLKKANEKFKKLFYMVKSKLPNVKAVRFDFSCKSCDRDHNESDSGDAKCYSKCRMREKIVVPKEWMDGFRYEFVFVYGFI